jgi:hypothetical protein
MNCQCIWIVVKYAFHACQSIMTVCLVSSASQWTTQILPDVVCPHHLLLPLNLTSLDGATKDILTGQQDGE